MKGHVYLDTTVPSYYFDDRDSIRFFIDTTRKWWKTESGDFHVSTSEATINELSRGNYPRKDDIIQFVLKLNILPFDETIASIAQVYIDNFLMPKDSEGDALHLAYASYYKIDFLLTWNCNHLANANKTKHIRVINTRMGLFIPEIITPLELFEETTDGIQR